MNATAYPRDDAHHARAVHAPDDASGWVLGVLRHSAAGRISVEFGGGNSVAYRCQRTSKLRRVSDRGVSRNGGVIVVVHEELRVLALLVDEHDLPPRLFAVSEELAVANPIERGGSVELFSVARVDGA
jgi:hypothetical protein